MIRSRGGSIQSFCIALVLVSELPVLSSDEKSEIDANRLSILA